MADPVVTYNSVNWETSYDIKIAEGGLNGLFDMPAMKDDGIFWVPGNITPVSEGGEADFRKIIVNGVMSKSSAATLHSGLITFTNAMLVLRKAGVFKTLKFWSTYTTSWSALPAQVLITFLGGHGSAKHARITVIFDCITDSLGTP